MLKWSEAIALFVGREPLEASEQVWERDRALLTLVALESERVREHGSCGNLSPIDRSLPARLDNVGELGQHAILDEAAVRELKSLIFRGEK